MPTILFPVAFFGYMHPNIFPAHSRSLKCLRIVKDGWLKNYKKK